MINMAPRRELAFRSDVRVVEEDRPLHPLLHPTDLRRCRKLSVLYLFAFRSNDESTDHDLKRRKHKKKKKHKRSEGKRCERKSKENSCERDQKLPKCGNNVDGV